MKCGGGLDHIPGLEIVEIGAAAATKAASVAGTLCIRAGYGGEGPIEVGHAGFRPFRNSPRWS
jgi:hypothetical protein